MTTNQKCSIEKNDDLSDVNHFLVLENGSLFVSLKIYFETFLNVTTPFVYLRLT